MEILKIRPMDKLQLKKPHPCGGDVFRVLRVGAEVRIVCEHCGRDLTVDRIKLEKAVRRILSTDGNQEKEHE